MTSDDLERRLQAWYQAEVGTREVAPPSLYASLAEVADAPPAPARRFGTRGFALVVASAIIMSLLVGGAIAIGSGLLSLPWAVDEVPRAQSMVWSESSLDEDWPAPIRDEGPGTAAVLPLVDPSLVDGSLGHYTDAVGDVGPAEVPWLDIEEVKLSGGGEPGVFGVIWAVDVQLAADISLPVPDPRVQWIAYGLVLDTTGDGVPDARIGMDNMPVTDAGHRAWRTELDSGRTAANPGGPYGLLGGRRYVDTWFPGESTDDLAEFIVGLNAAEPTFRFYAWASLIEDGRVVATDYAPDVGWLEPPRGADR